jgi:hypothetical protein
MLIYSSLCEVIIGGFIGYQTSPPIDVKNLPIVFRNVR